jgi:hypothetical protein
MNDDLKYLIDYRRGKIVRGLGIGCSLDNNIVFKRGQLNIILGHDNVGKSLFINWYFLNLALKHNLKFVIYSGENKTAYIFRDWIQMLAGMRYNELGECDIVELYERIKKHFIFIPNDRLYKPQDLFEKFEQSKCDAALIDPFTALDREMSYDGNYRFLNAARELVNYTGMTLYINTHPTSESGRAGNLYAPGHEWNGHVKAPLKDHVEGGKAFLNRCDDMFVIHRLVKHETMKYYTMINVEKIKDLDTGGRHTNLNEPILCEFNNGLGFKIGGVDPLQSIRGEIKKGSNSFPAQTSFDDILSFSEKIKRMNEQNNK